MKGLGDALYIYRGFGDALYIYRFEIMILLRVKAKSLLCYWVVRDLGISMAELQKRAHSPSRCKSGTAGHLQLSRRLKLSLSGVSLSVKRGERMAQENDYKLIEPERKTGKLKGVPKSYKSLYGTY